MANREDVIMLQNAINNAGESALQRRQMSYQQQAMMQRLAMENEMRKIQEARYNAQAQHYNQMEGLEQQRGIDEGKRLDAATAKANAAKIQTDLYDPVNGTRMTFTGSQDQLDQMQQSYKQKTGRDLQLSQPKQFSAVFNVGGAQFSFQDQDSADKFASDFKKNHGIDLYAQQGGAGNSKAPFEQAMASYKSELDAANTATDVVQKTLHQKNAAMYLQQAQHLNQFAPKYGTQTQIQRNQNGEETNRIETPFMIGQPSNNPDLPTSVPLTMNPTGMNSNGIPTGQAPSTVRVRHPNGMAGTIPSTNLDAALQQGYQLIQ